MKICTVCVNSSLTRSGYCEACAKPMQKFLHSQRTSEHHEPDLNLEPLLTLLTLF
jgi:hypothetical protein